MDVQTNLDRLPECLPPGAYHVHRRLVGRAGRPLDALAEDLPAGLRRVNLESPDGLLLYLSRFLVKISLRSFARFSRSSTVNAFVDSFTGTLTSLPSRRSFVTFCSCSTDPWKVADSSGSTRIRSQNSPF